MAQGNAHRSRLRNTSPLAHVARVQFRSVAHAYETLLQSVHAQLAQQDDHVEFGHLFRADFVSHRARVRDQFVQHQVLLGNSRVLDTQSRAHVSQRIGQIVRESTCAVEARFDHDVECEPIAHGHSSSFDENKHEQFGEEWCPFEADRAED
jgi:hypothetical protein